MLQRLKDWWNRDKNTCAFITIHKKNLSRLAAKLDAAHRESKEETARLEAAEKNKPVPMDGLNDHRDQ